jgi:hypothetical protein
VIAVSFNVKNLLVNNNARLKPELLKRRDKPQRLRRA